MSSETKVEDKKPTPDGQHIIDLAKLHGCDEDDDRWGPLALVIAVIGLYFGVKLVWLAGGGACKPDSRSTTYLDHQNTNQSAIYLDHKANHPWEKQK